MAIRRAARDRVSQARAGPVAPEPRLFTVDEYYEMAEAGILRPDEKVQLIEGVIVQMPQAGMYSLHGVPELWVVDLQADRVVVYREPTADGYASVRTVARGESISPLAFPDVSFTADGIVG